MQNKSELQKIAQSVREDILEISYNAHIGHIGSALSIVEILVGLYFDTLNIDPKEPLDKARDRFILSKGHAAAAFYSVLYRRGFIDRRTLKSFCQDGSKLLVHPEWNGLPGVEHATGSLAHGMGVAVGMAFACKKLNAASKIYVLSSDAELNEGESWEAALFAGHHKLNNLTVIVDYNGSQAFGRVSEILELEPMEAKWSSFNFDVITVDGHDIDAVVGALKNKRGRKSNKPKVVIAKTVLGKGVSFMEKKFEWHYYNTTEEQQKKALEEVQNGKT